MNENCKTEYPLYIDDKLAGTLSVTREGLFTRFEASIPDTGELTRLYIYGSGMSACLGVMLPRNGRMVISKRLSRAAMAALPPEIECASDSPAKQRPTDGEDVTLWLSSPSGILYTEGLVALPLASCRFRVSGIVRHINGRDYAVFPGKSRRSSKKDW